MQHIFKRFSGYRFHALRHPTQGDTTPAPGALHHQGYVCFRRTFQEQHRTGQVIGEDHFIIHRHQPVTHANAGTCRGTIRGDSRHQHLAALRRKA